MSARSSWAPLPASTVKRASASFTPRSKSRMPRSVPRSQWGLGSKPSAEKSRGVPHFLTSTFSESSLPSGTQSAGMLGIRLTSSVMAESASSRWASSTAIRSLRARTPALASSASSALPAFMRAPISLDVALRWACRVSTSAMAARRCLSSSRKRSLSQLPLRRAIAASSTSGWSRSRRMSCMSSPPTYRLCRRADGAGHISGNIGQV